jgi:hypothetical protein
MPFSRKLILALGVCIFLAASQSARADVITFDDTTGAISSNRYQSQGVILSSISSDPYYSHMNPIIVPDSRSTSAPNILRNQACFSSNPSDACYAATSINFVLPGTTTAGIVSTFSFDVVGGNPGIDGSGQPYHYFIRALDVNNEDLFLQSYTSDGLTHHFSYAGNPSVFTVIFYTSRSLEGIDNFSFGPISVAPPRAVPEPATLLLLGSGLAGAAARFRRRRKTS